MASKSVPLLWPIIVGSSTVVEGMYFQMAPEANVRVQCQRQGERFSEGVFCRFIPQPARRHTCLELTHNLQSTSTKDYLLALFLA